MLRNNDVQDKKVGLAQVAKRPRVSMSRVSRVHAYKNLWKGILFFVFSYLLPLSATANWISDYFYPEQKALSEGLDKIMVWNTVNKRSFFFENSTLGCDINRICSFSSKITNNTKEKIEYVVININLYNKKSDDLVYSQRETLSVSTFPSITKEFTDYISNKEMAEAIKQLRENDGFSWDFSIVCAVPEEMWKSIKWLTIERHNIGEAVCKS